MKAFTAAQQAFNEENFAEAARLLEKAYMIEPKPELLYPWAQAERNQGHCDVAIDLYQQFLDSGVKGQFAEAAKQNIERCREEAAAAEEETATEEEEGGEVVPVPEPEDDDEPAPRKTSDEKEPRDRKVRKWYADPVGDTLFAVGLVGVGVGGGLLGVAMSAAKKAPDADTNDDYVAERDRATKFRNGGAAALGIGGALIVGAVVRWVLVARKSKSSKTATAWYDGRSGGVALTGRF